MADDSEQGGGEPDLELPKLFGRKKKDRADEQAPVAEPVEAVEADDEPTRRLPPVPPPEQTAPPVEPVEPPVEPVPAPAPIPAPEPPPAPEPVPAPEPPPAPEPVPAPVPPPAPAPVPTPGPEPFPDPGPEPQTEPIRFAAPPPPPPVQQQPPTKPPKPPRERKPLVLPRINPYLAAVVVGAFCGLVAVLLEILTQRGCEAVRGVGSCGGLGLVALLVILALEIAVGAVLLRAFGVADPTSTSFLGVGIVAVLAMMFFLGSIDSPWMFLVLPVMTAAAFAISYWITDAVVAVPKDEDESTTVT